MTTSPSSADAGEKVPTCPRCGHVVLKENVSGIVGSTSEITIGEALVQLREAMLRAAHRHARVQDVVVRHEGRYYTLCRVCNRQETILVVNS